MNIINVNIIIDNKMNYYLSISSEIENAINVVDQWYSSLNDAEHLISWIVIPLSDTLLIQEVIKKYSDNIIFTQSGGLIMENNISVVSNDCYIFILNPLFHDMISENNVYNLGYIKSVYLIYPIIDQLVTRGYCNSRKSFNQKTYNLTIDNIS